MVDIIDNPVTPVVLSNEALAWAITQHTGAIIGVEEVSDFFEEFKDNLQLQGEIRYLALTYSGKMVDNWQTAIDWQAAEVAQTGVWGYAGAHDVIEFLKQALDGTSEGGGAFFRLKALLETVIPYCIQNMIPLPDVVLAKDNKSKLAQVGERAPGVIEAAKLGQITDEDAQAAVKSMVADAIDPGVTVEVWKDKHPAQGHREKDKADAWVYIEPDNASYLVIKFNAQRDLDATLKLLRNRVVTHVGSGAEEFIQGLYLVLEKMVGHNVWH